MMFDCFDKRIGSRLRWVALLLLPGAFFAACSHKSSFGVADANRDGTVSREEFEDYMLKRVFADADRDGDGRITWEEWTRANPSADIARFQVPDTDGDQAISRSELRAQLKGEQVSVLFDKIDADGNGQISEIEDKRFKAELIMTTGSSPLEKLAKMVDESNGDDGSSSDGTPSADESAPLGTM